LGISKSGVIVIGTSPQTSRVRRSKCIEYDARWHMGTLSIGRSHTLLTLRSKALFGTDRRRRCASATAKRSPSPNRDGTETEQDHNHCHYGP
jgi:hypothetical protein